MTSYPEPLEVLSNSLGKPVWLITRDTKEYTGTLLGFDEYVNVVLLDATEYERLEGGLFSEEAICGKVFLNGSSVEIIVPGGKPPQ